MGLWVSEIELTLSDFLQVSLPTEPSCQPSVESFVERTLKINIKKHSLANLKHFFSKYLNFLTCELVLH